MMITGRKKIWWLLVCLPALLFANYAASLSTTAKEKNKHMYTYLALGDSYTIGEQVPMKENFPHQLVAMMRDHHFDVADPVIIAKTGWTTDELAAAIREHNITE